MRRVVACGVRWGKTRTCIWEVIAALLSPGPDSIGWVVGPNLDVVDLTLREVRHVLRERLPHRLVAVDERDRHIVVRNLAGGLSEVRGKSGGDPGSLLGEGLDWLVVDEAVVIKRRVWEEYLLQRLSDKDGWALIVSVPNGIGDWFHDLYRRGVEGEAGYAAWQYPTSENPLLDRVVLERERKAVPVAVFAEQYEAEFLGEFGPQCGRCGAPSPMARGGMVLFEGDELHYCPDCGRPVTAEGVPLGIPDGEGGVRLAVVRVHEAHS